MTDLEMEVDREIRSLITAAKVAEETAAAAAQTAKIAQENAIAARRAAEQALTTAANKGFHVSWWEFRPQGRGESK
jgi:hypothetical protein